MYNFVEINDKNEWDTLIASHGENAPLQLYHFGELNKKAYHFEVKRLLIEHNSQPVLLAQIVKKRIFADQFLHINNGPIIIGENYGEPLKYLVSILDKLGYFTRGVNRLKIEPRWCYNASLKKVLDSCNFVESRRGGLQPGFGKATLILDLNQDLDHLRSQMSYEARRHIRPAIARGVVIRKSKTNSDFEAFLRLLKEVSEQKGFLLQSDEWYKELLTAPDLKTDLYLADYGGRTVAAAIFLYYQDTVCYLLSASRPLATISPPRLLLWRAITEAKDRGFNKFDFWGIDSARAPELLRFKKSFSGKEIRFLGAYDYRFYL